MPINIKISMTFNYTEFFSIGILLVFSFFLSSLILDLSLQLSTSNADEEKISPYECGFNPIKDARAPFEIRFYLIAILFIVFDLEAVYFFPWCTSLSFLFNESFYGMLDFLFELVVGYIYAWKVGALDWE